MPDRDFQVTMLCILVSVILLILAMSYGASAVSARDESGLSIEVIVNPVEGSPHIVCTLSSEMKANSQERWMTFAKVKPHEKKGWKAFDSEVRCAGGPLDENSSDFKATDGVPYLIAGISAVTRRHQSMLIPDKVHSLDVTISLRRLKAFGAEDDPVYSESVEKRTSFFLDGGDTFIPLFIADSMEREEFGIYEVFMKVAMKMEREKSVTAYGAIMVTCRKRGGELFLDRSKAGNISAGSEIILRNLPAGLREVGMRDSSGNYIGRVISVVANRTSLVDLDPFDPEQKSSRYHLTFLGKNTQGYEEYRRESDGAVVIKIPAGDFLMGNRETERSPLEHRVYVSEFMMDKTGVSWGQYKRFAEATGVPLPVQVPYWGIHDDHPAVYVTWEDAKNYCEWAGARLPTEAEREKAARGTDGRKYPWGDEEPDPQRAVFRRNWGKEATAAVGTHPAGASPYGLQDMGGNVWEWCSDWYDNGYYEVSPYRDPKGPSSGIAHVVRGGSWDSRPDVLSSSCRSWGHIGYREGDFGFRCSMDVPR